MVSERPGNSNLQPRSRTAGLGPVPQSRLLRVLGGPEASRQGRLPGGGIRRRQQAFQAEGSRGQETALRAGRNKLVFLDVAVGIFWVQSERQCSSNRLMFKRSLLV